MQTDQRNNHREEGVDVPYEQISAETLKKMIEEFVTREWSELNDSGHTLEEKVEQVLQQFRDKKIKVVFDLRSETANIVVCK